MAKDDNDDLFSAKRMAELGAQRALDHAEAVIPSWGDQALSFFQRYAQNNPAFLTEDVRVWAHQNGLDLPPEPRAWGQIPKMAVKLGIVIADGYAATQHKPAHSKAMRLWRSLVFTPGIRATT